MVFLSASTPLTLPLISSADNRPAPSASTRANMTGIDARVIRMLLFWRGSVEIIRSRSFRPPPPPPPPHGGGRGGWGRGAPPPGRRAGVRPPPPPSRGGARGGPTQANASPDWIS